MRPPIVDAACKLFQELLRTHILHADPDLMQARLFIGYKPCLSQRFQYVPVECAGELNCELRVRV